MLPTMLEHDRKRAGWSVGEAAWRLGVSIREYRELEAGERMPNFAAGDGGYAATSWYRLTTGAGRAQAARYLATPKFPPAQPATTIFPFHCRARAIPSARPSENSVRTLPPTPNDSSIAP